MPSSYKKALNLTENRGRSVLMGEGRRGWQDTDTILSCFGRGKKDAIGGYESFVKDGMLHGRRLDPEYGRVASGSFVEEREDTGK